VGGGLPVKTNPIEPQMKMDRINRINQIKKMPDACEAITGGVFDSILLIL
jgi:hypothetical protein